MKYVQFNAEERSAMAALRTVGVEPCGNCAATRAASEHGVPGVEAQRLAA